MAAVTCNVDLIDTKAVANPSSATGKFRLVQSACIDQIAIESKGHEAAQLGLYRAPAGPLPSDVEGDTQAAPAPRPAAAAQAETTAPAGAGSWFARIRALAPAIAETARLHGIDPLLLHAVAHVESRHNTNAKSRAGARGVLQVMPDTGRRFGLSDPEQELHSPERNLHVAATYLKELQRRFGNDLPLVLAAYNAGEGAVEKYRRRIPPYPETEAYVREVLRVYRELRHRLRGEQPDPTQGTV